MRAVIEHILRRHSCGRAWGAGGSIRLIRWKAGTIYVGLSSPIVRDGLWSFALKLAYTGVQFLVTVVLARVLGAEGYGIYAYAYALVMLLSLPAQAGLPNLVLRETARGIAEGRPDLVQGVWRWASQAGALVSVALIGLAAALLVLLRGGRMGVQEWALAWALSLVPLVVLGNIRGAALRGLGCIVPGQLPEFVIRPGLFLVLALGLGLVSSGRPSAAAAMALHVAAAAIAFIVGGFMLWRFTPRAVWQTQPQYAGQAWLSSVFPLAIIAAMQTINHQADILILGLFQSDREVGLYRVAVQSATLASFGLQAVNTVVAPRFARLYTKGKMDELQRLATISARVVLSFNVAVTVLFVLFGKVFLISVFGPAFVASYIPLLILLLGQFINAAMGSVGFLLNMTGHEKDTARVLVIAASINVILNFLCIPWSGMVGAAFASATSMALWNALLWRTARRRLGINTMAFSLSKE